MKFYMKKKDAKRIEGPGHVFFPLLDERNGCVEGCKTGLSIYFSDEYPSPGIHDDQEGFIVMEGKGWAKIGSDEFPLEPEMSFIAPAKTPHAIKKDAEAQCVKLFWFHAAV